MPSNTQCNILYKMAEKDKILHKQEILCDNKDWSQSIKQ